MNRTFGRLERLEQRGWAERSAVLVGGNHGAHELRERLIKVLVHHLLESGRIEQRERALERRERAPDSEFIVRGV
jgi:hypothetical protein